MLLSAAPNILSQSDRPLSPSEALAAFRLEPGLRIELVASEPLVVDPVAMAFDERGRIYVAENRGYPTGPEAGAPPVGVIALLEDPDGDGMFDRRTVFADRLSFPNGVMPWKGGVFVTCAPDLFYLKDTDGDGRADERQVFLTGFDASNTSQLRVSHPTLAIDNWIYLSCGLTGGRITSPLRPEQRALEIKTDFRFRPDLSAYEAADGRGQFGMSFDDQGQRFLCNNRVHIQHVVLPSRYLRRNPHLAFSESVQPVPELMMPEPLRGHGASARIFPISQNVTTADSHAGTFTAACGLLIYRGRALPEEFWGNAFVCDPTGNLVHRDRLRPVGATFAARPTREGIETVASTDNWFRPVNLAAGPDGALYICDMYRRTIEHPQYLPEEVRKRTDFTSGNDRGRIYRVTSAARPRAAPNRSRDLSKATVRDLCEELENADGWARDTAHRLLLERQDKASVPLLRAMTRKLNSRTPVSRLHALSLLDGLNELTSGDLRYALQDPFPGVREHAVKWVETRLGTNDSSIDWNEAVLPLATDPDPRVRFQVALTIGHLGASQVLPALLGIIKRGADDRWTRAAVLSSLSGRASQFLRELLASPVPSRSEGWAEFLFELGRVVGAGESVERLPELTAAVVEVNTGLDHHHKRSLINGLVAGGRSRGLTGGQALRIAESEPRAPSGVGQIKRESEILLKRARTDALDGALPVVQRRSAIEFLENSDAPETRAVLLRLLELDQPAALQSASVKVLAQAIASGGDFEAIRTVLDARRWAQYTPSVQQAIIDSFLANPRTMAALLEAIERGDVPGWALSAAQKGRLLKARDDAIRGRAENLFQKRVDQDRMKVFEQTKNALALSANARRGRELFAKHCASCHRLDREGVAVGPDLFSIRNQPKEAILLHIIVPDQEVVPGFASYEVQTKDGRELSGLVVSETETSLTLRGVQGIEESLLRSNIESIAASQVSMMPAGFESVMTHQELADLVAYLKGEMP